MEDLGHEQADVMVERLRKENKAKGLIVFGSRAKGTGTGGSDVDLLVVLDAGDRKIEVLHPCIDGGIRIDVWLRTVSELRHLEVVIGQGGRMDENPFVLNAIETGKVLKDFHGTLQRLQDTLRSKKAKWDVNFWRFQLTHGLEGLENIASQGDSIAFEIMCCIEMADCLERCSVLMELSARSTKDILLELRNREPSLYRLVEDAVNNSLSREERLQHVRDLQDWLLRDMGGRVGEEEFIATSNDGQSGRVVTKEGLKVWRALTGE